MGLARPDKFGLPIRTVETLLMEFLEARDIEICHLPPALETTHFALSAAHRYRSGRRGLNLGDCLHYACAKYYDVPMLATDNGFRETDIATVP